MLKVLPPHISNLIAAGEVVQRPASVVKELIENSIDAGANSISVNILDSGRTLIQIIDNGCGMSDEDAKLCFLRHSTSKISEASDLENICTLGFRGEALASIAAVSEVCLKTKKQDEELGSVTHFCESNFISQEAASTPQGTNIAIRNLFYNIPARRKFLKSDNYEFRQIVTEFSRIALSRPEISFSLNHNGKDVYKLQGSTELEKRILQIAGKNLQKELIKLSTSTSLISIDGFIGIPEESRKSLGLQYFFINGRFFKSPYLHKAIIKAYEKLIPEGHSPSYFLFMEVNPNEVDVNIHPSKMEVKFENDAFIFEILNAATREALGKNSLYPSIDFDVENAPEIPMAPKKGTYIPMPKINFDPLFNPFEDEKSTVEDFRPSYLKKDVDEVLFKEEIIPERTFILIKKKYLVSSHEAGLLIIHLNRAWQRIYYERLIHSLDNSVPAIQTSMFPQKIELDINSVSILSEFPGRLLTLGYDIDILDQETICVKGLPNGFPSDLESTKGNIADLVGILKESESEDLLRAEVRHKLASTMSRCASRRKSQTMTNQDANNLIDCLFNCIEPDRSPEGKATMKILNIENLENLL